MYIKTYSEYMAYSDIFWTVDMFSQFQERYSGVLKSNLYVFWTLFRQIQTYLELWLI